MHDCWLIASRQLLELKRWVGNEIDNFSLHHSIIDTQMAKKKLCGRRKKFFALIVTWVDVRSCWKKKCRKNMLLRSFSPHPTRLKFEANSICIEILSRRLCRGLTYSCISSQQEQQDVAVLRELRERKLFPFQVEIYDFGGDSESANYTEKSSVFCLCHLTISLVQVKKMRIWLFIF